MARRGENSCPHLQGSTYDIRPDARPRELRPAVPSLSAREKLRGAVALWLCFSPMIFGPQTPSGCTCEGAGTGSCAIPHLLPVPWCWSRASSSWPTGGLQRACRGKAENSKATFEERSCAGKSLWSTPSVNRKPKGKLSIPGRGLNCNQLWTSLPQTLKQHQLQSLLQGNCLHMNYISEVFRLLCSLTSLPATSSVWDTVLGGWGFSFWERYKSFWSFLWGKKCSVTSLSFSTRVCLWEINYFFFEARKLFSQCTEITFPTCTSHPISLHMVSDFSLSLCVSIANTNKHVCAHARTLPQFLLLTWI